MFQPIKIQKCTQLKTGRFITVVQTVNLCFTKLLYTALWGNLSWETKLGERREMKIYCWQKDIFKSNESICGVVLQF